MLGFLGDAFNTLKSGIVGGVSGAVKVVAGAATKVWGAIEGIASGAEKWSSSAAGTSGAGTAGQQPASGPAGAAMEVVKKPVLGLPLWAWVAIGGGLFLLLRRRR